METIASFQIDHDSLKPGCYVSRLDGDITTYDLRFIAPNTPPYLSPEVCHTIEHLFATYARNSRFSESIVYFGPMGCGTGFYLIVRDLAFGDTLTLIDETLKACISHEGEIFGATKQQCGNYRLHDLDGAIAALKQYYSVYKNWTIYDLQYKNCG